MPDVKNEYESMLQAYDTRVKPVTINDQIKLIERVSQTPHSQRKQVEDVESRSNRSRMKSNRGSVSSAKRGGNQKLTKSQQVEVSVEVLPTTQTMSTTIPASTTTVSVQSIENLPAASLQESTTTLTAQDEPALSE